VIALVTGVAGFIGGTLASALRSEGWEVRGIDARAVDQQIVDRGQTGVRSSWSSNFAGHVRNNVASTQRLLEAARVARVRRFVLASSSSVYGNVGGHQRGEESAVSPFSPYGVTKHAAEELCRVYADNFGVHAVVLRYFTVYGPRQRPDMSIHRLIDAALDATPFELYGDGSQSRDFTFVDDTVRATIAASMAAVPPGTIIDVGGGSAVTMSRLIEALAPPILIPSTPRPLGPSALRSHRPFRSTDRPVPDSSACRSGGRRR
jgi:UDP-glucuronate 4-epimerase